MSNNEKVEPTSGSSESGAEAVAQSGLVGRELDAAIAERVMGFTRAPVAPHPTDNRAISGVLYYLPNTPWDRNQQNVVPYFSSDISAAWQVVECLQKQGCTVSANASSDRKSWWAVIYPLTGKYVESEFCPSAPEAICRAALEIARQRAEGGTT